MQLQPAKNRSRQPEGLYEQSGLENAQITFKKVFEQTADQALHGQACFRAGAHRHSRKPTARSEAII